MSEQRNSAPVNVGEHGLKKHDIKVSTVVFMIFCLVAAGCYGIEEMIPECGPGLTNRSGLLQVPPSSGRKSWMPSPHRHPN